MPFPGLENLIDYRAVIIDLAASPLTSDHRRQLARRIREIHAVAFNWNPQELVPDEVDLIVASYDRRATQQGGLRPLCRAVVQFSWNSLSSIPKSLRTLILPNWFRPPYKKNQDADANRCLECTTGCSQPPKGGVPPGMGIAHIAVGMERLESSTRALLADDTRPRWFAVSGEYGGGEVLLSSSFIGDCAMRVMRSLSWILTRTLVR